jgi:hypothetical protein
VQARHWENVSGSECQNNRTQNKFSGNRQFGKTGKKGKRVIDYYAGRVEVFHGLFLGMLRMESGKFNAFMRAWVGEVKVNNNKEKE